MERHKRRGVARPYAKALFELAEKPAVRDAWQRVLQALGLIVANPSFSAALHHPRLRGEDLSQFIRAVCEPFLQTDQQRDFLTLLVKNGRLECAPEIYELYLGLRQADEQVAAVTVTSAYPLDKEQQRELESSLKRYLRRRPVLKTRVNKNLLGGIRLRIGDQVIDATVVGRLRGLLSHLLGDTTGRSQA